MAKTLKNTFGGCLYPNVSILNISDRTKSNHTQKASERTKLVFIFTAPIHHKSVMWMPYMLQSCYMEIIKLIFLKIGAKFSEKGNSMFGWVKENSFVIVINQLMIHFCKVYSFWPSQMDVYSRHWRHGCVFGGTFFKKGICFLAPHKQISFSTISNGTIFFKSQATKLGATITLKKFPE